MATHEVRANTIKVSLGVGKGNRIARILRAGDVLPEGIDDDQLKSLLKRKLIAAKKTVERAPASPVYSQADVDAAVQAAVDAKVAELAQADEKPADVVETAAAVKKPATPAKAPAAK